MTQHMSDATFYNSNIALLACQFCIMLISLGVALYAVKSARAARTVTSLAASKTYLGFWWVMGG